MLVNFIKALIVGIAVSVPLGPVGMLCIQKTLSKGQLRFDFRGHHAFLAGIRY